MLNEQFHNTMIEAGYNERSLSIASGVARGTINRMIKGKEVMPLTASKICQALSKSLQRRITPEELLLALKLPKI